jgi:SAM-dependent methyltransferase
MDVLVIPYPNTPHFKDYGFPMKVYEYMASGVPIIYTKLELLEEIIYDCAYGVAPDSPQELAKCASFIQGHQTEARTNALKAKCMVEKLTWSIKARTILEICKRLKQHDIIIPSDALKYILFQRTEFSIYTLRSWILRLVMNKYIPIYNFSVAIEAFLFRSRTKRLFSADMNREYSHIRDYLPSNLENILDIGCGVAGIDVLLYKHYQTRNIFPDFYLLDKSEINTKVYYGLEKIAAYYSSLKVAEKLLVTNGIQKSRIHLQEVTGAPIFPNKSFDLIISLISWGFHYPISIYLDEVYRSLVPDGKLIVDVRKNSGGEELLKEKFGSINIISEAKKYRRVLVIKKLNHRNE